MKKLIFLVLLESAIALSSNAQSTRYFVRDIGHPYPVVENTNSVVQLPNGSYMTFGETLSNAVFIKTDSYGNTLIDSVYADTAYTTLWVDAHLESDGNIIVAGWHYKNNIMNETDSTENMWLVKMDTTGNIIWSSLLGDTLVPSDAMCVKKTLDGGYILGGFADLIPQQGIIIKTDSMRHKLWEIILGGTFNDDAFNDVVILPDSGFAFTGYHNDAAPNNTGDLWFVRTDKNGTIIKDTTYNFSGNNNLGTENVGGGIGLSHDGGYIIGGYYDDTANGRGLLIKLNSDYSVAWQKGVTGASNAPVYSYLSKIIVLPDGSIIGSGAISGYTSGFAGYIIKFDSSGNEIWKRYYKLSSPGYYDYFYGIDTTSDGGFILCGRSENPNGPNDPFIKTNCLGFVAPPTASFRDSLGYYSTVYFTNTSINTDTCYWNWGDGSSIQMVRADSTTPVLHTYTSQGPFNVMLIAIACGEADTIIVQTPLVTGIPNPDVNEKQVFIYPNPNDGSFTLSYNLSSSNSQLFIKDVTGRIVYVQNINGLSGKESIDVSGLSNGVYFYQIRNNKETVQGKFVKESF